MRWPALAATAALVLSGCIGWGWGCGDDCDHGCMVSDRAVGWVQPAYWEWRPANLTLEYEHVFPEHPWPEPPASWEGNNSVHAVRHQVAGDHEVRVTDSNPGMSVSAFLPQRMKAADREAAIRTAVEGATNATPGQVAAVVEDLMAADEGGDSSGRFMAVAAAGFGFDLAGLATLGEWSAAPRQPGQWELRNGSWTVEAFLDSARADQGANHWAMDAGGVVRGLTRDVAVPEPELRNATVAYFTALGAPAPTFERAIPLEQMVCG